MKTIKELLFLVTFTVGHAFVTLSLLGVYNARDVGSVLQRLCNLIVIILMCPFMLPLVLLNGDGDRTPQWLQWCALWGDSLLCAVAVLLLFTGIKRLLNRKQAKRMANTIEETSR